MTVLPLESESIDLAHIRTQVDTILADFMQSKTQTAAAHGWPDEITTTLGDLLFAGGKRLRPTLCVIGWHAAGGPSLAPDSVLRVAAALEMFHAFALIHDDIMDNSTTRRGQPTAHRILAARHQGRSGAAQLGVHSAILLGDLTLVWSDELLHTADLATGQPAAVLGIVDTMRTELVYGQYLDLTATGQPTADLHGALTITRYKTAKYTVERPLHIGAALGRADDTLQTALSAYALPIGEAFQLRDDLLGVYGHPGRTGKPRLDDLRDGKHTALVALALTNADATRHALLKRLLGGSGTDEYRASEFCEVLDATGARNAVERMIHERRDQADRVLRQGLFPPPVTRCLSELAHEATVRTT